MPVSPSYIPSPAACQGNMPQSNLQYSIDIRTVPGTPTMAATYTPAGSNTSVSVTFAQAVAMAGGEKELLDSFIPEANMRIPSIDAANLPAVLAETSASAMQQLVAERIYDYQNASGQAVLKNPQPYPNVP